MAYIGKQPVVGNFVKLDAITTSATATYNLLNGGVAYFPQTANNCIVSLNGVIQSPTSAYTISGSTIVFSDALTASDSIDFILVLGDVLSIGTPSDGTITSAKIVDANVTTAKLVDGSVTAAKVAAGAVVQVVSTNKTDTFASSSIANTFVDVTGLSVSITPSSASNKILILATVNHGTDGIRATALKLLRDSTAINIGTASGDRTVASTVAIGENYDTNRGEVSSINFLDSPATTSSVTYKIQIGIIESTGNVARVNTSGADGNFTYIARAASTITVMEIKA
jgi:hypothetical protein